ncbi:MAG: hypothetical protein KTR31_32385 [Myxococcales bacterium]|nr:hypothetical protein [Myxococcales bacterium]
MAEGTDGSRGGDPRGPGLWTAGAILGVSGVVVSSGGCIAGLLTTPGNGMGEGYFHWMLCTAIGLLVATPMLLFSAIFLLMATAATSKR